MSRSSNDTKRIIGLIFLLLIVSLIGYGIYTWTQYLELRQAEQLLQDAARTVLLEKGETGLLELAGVSDKEEAGPLSIIAEALSVFSRQGYADFNEEEQENIDIYEKYNKAVVNITTQNYQYNLFLSGVHHTRRFGCQAGQA